MSACWGNKSVNVMRTTSGALAFYLYHPQMQLATWSGIDLARWYSHRVDSIVLLLAGLACVNADVVAALPSQEGLTIINASGWSRTVSMVDMCIALRVEEIATGVAIPWLQVPACILARALRLNPPIRTENEACNFVARTLKARAHGVPSVISAVLSSFGMMFAFIVLTLLVYTLIRVLIPRVPECLYI